MYTEFCTYTLTWYLFSRSHPCLYVHTALIRVFKFPSLVSTSTLSPPIHVFPFPSLFARTLSPPIYVFAFPSHFVRILSPSIHVFEFPSLFVSILSPLIHVFAFPSLFPEVRRGVPLVARSSGAMAAVLLRIPSSLAAARCGFSMDFGAMFVEDRPNALASFSYTSCSRWEKISLIGFWVLIWLRSVQDWIRNWEHCCFSLTGC
jgi:hypothetical protein